MAEQSQGAGQHRAQESKSWRNSKLPEHDRLQYLQEEIEKVALGYGLTFPEVRFQMVDTIQMNALAAGAGFIRYPHWRFGMEYEGLSKRYEYGLAKIYEMVVNNDPVYAFLLSGNDFVSQKMVMAHVYGHADFFHNNAYFAHTDRKMADRMGNHRSRISRYQDRYGVDTVEAFIDACMSLENLIDVSQPRRKEKADEERFGSAPGEEEGSQRVANAGRLPVENPHLERFINPPEALAEAKARQLELEAEKKGQFPEHPERDVLAFLMEHAPLEAWQRDVLSIVREEAIYFLPQRQTKIMNEGWASFWHTKLMTEHFLEGSEVVSFADYHSGVVATPPGQLNPYKLGLDLFRHIKERWDTGRFGYEYAACDNMAERAAWHRETNQGLEKIFEVRKVHNDITFIDTFLTPEFCQEAKLFMYRTEPNTGHQVITHREVEPMKRKILDQLANCGEPLIELVDANYGNRGELVLEHRHFGQDLDWQKARRVMKNLFVFWTRPVHLLAVREGKAMRFRYDGHSYEQFDEEDAGQ